VNFGTRDFARCAVFAGTIGLGGHTAVVGAGVEVGNISTMGAFKRTSPTKIRLRCWHDNRVKGIYADAGAIIWAHRSSGLTLPE
jgi:hypothetical protein